MQLIRLLRQESSAAPGVTLLMAVLAGGASALMLALANIAADAAANRTLELRLFLAYLVALGLYLTAGRYSFISAMTAMEGALRRVKLRIADKVRRVELPFIESCDGLGAFSPLTQDSSLIAQSAMTVVMVAQSLLVLVIASLYLAWLSPASLATAVVFLGIGLPWFAARRDKTRREQEAVAEREGALMGRFEDMMQGFKELKMGRHESDDLLARIRTLNEEVRTLRTDIGVRGIYDVMLGSSMIYVLLFLLVVVVPWIAPTGVEQAHEVVATMLFLIGPLGIITNFLPLLARTEAAIGRLYGLEAKLDAALMPDADEAAPARTGFGHITLDDVVFSYRDADGAPLFTSGPHQLSIASGDLVYIIGGNGAGKSTFLKLLLGLYRPDTGVIRVDGAPVGAADYPSYRSLFSIVLGDFHLFRRLYGLPAEAKPRVPDWIERLELARKTGFDGAGFTHTDLSTGQRKRLAFIAAVERGRPVLVLDEVAADQDPEFRRRFYTEILPGLRDAGRTVLVVSHDDEYFHLADRLLVLEDGRIVSTPAAAESSA